MSDPGRLQRAEIVPDAGEYILQLSLADGTRFDVIATFDQLDTLAEDIDRRLDEDDS